MEVSPSEGGGGGGEGEGEGESVVDLDTMLMTLTNEMEVLEKAELKVPDPASASGNPSEYGLQAEPYARLFAIYLVLNDMTSAKFLWKRIPAEMKQQQSTGSELGQLWAIGTTLWRRDFGEAFLALKAHQWPAYLKNHMKALELTTRQRSVDLIRKSYTSLSQEMFCHLTGTDPTSLKESVASLGWRLDPVSNFVLPSQPPRNTALEMMCDRELAKLTTIIGSIEN